MSMPYYGEIRIWANTYAPLFWEFCDGAYLPIMEYTPLFAVIGTTYGGDGRNNFRLPDMQGRVPLGEGAAPGLNNYIQGTRWGFGTATLAEPNLPKHKHILRNVTADGSKVKGTQATPDINSVWARIDPRGYWYDELTANSTVVPMSVNALGISGNSLPHENCQPYLGMNFCIAVENAIFPSRN